MARLRNDGPRTVPNKKRKKWPWWSRFECNRSRPMNPNTSKKSPVVSTAENRYVRDRKPR